MEPVYILGGGRTDFKRNLKKEGKTIRDLITESGRKAIDDAKIDPAEIQAAAVGNFNAGQFTKQLHLGAFIPEIDPKLAPRSRVKAPGGTRRAASRRRRLAHVLYAKRLRTSSGVMGGIGGGYWGLPPRVKIPGKF